MRQYKKAKITPATLGQVLISRCGNEGKWPSNTAEEKRDREFLQKGISFVPQAVKEGADLENTAFIFSIPGRDFAVTSGNHDWEFTFSEENGSIGVKCTRETTTHWLWNVAHDCWSQSVDYATELAFRYLTLRHNVKHPTLTAGVHCSACSELNSSSASYCNRCGKPLN